MLLGFVVGLFVGVAVCLARAASRVLVVFALWQSGEDDGSNGLNYDELDEHPQAAAEAAYVLTCVSSE